jgi:nucleotide-binding universal stress UspA family protein
MVRLGQDAGVSVEHRLVAGIPDLSILDMAQESGAGMIVMGTHGRTGWDRLQFGSTAASIVQKASCPVLTVHAAIVGDLPMTPRRLRLARLLVATDFQADAQAALRAAVDLAEALGGTILLVHASDDGSRPASEETTATAAPSRASAKQQLEQALAELKERGLGADAILTPGHATEVVLKEAEHRAADIIVMGTRRSTAFRRLALGSVADSVIRRAGCPVLVVKARQNSQ